MKIHHVGYLTKNLSDSEQAFMKLGYKTESPANYDPLRKIMISFLVNESYRIELIEPCGSESPMYSLLKKYKNTPYHICYETEALEPTISMLENQGYVLIQKPSEAPCIKNQRVAFLIGESMGIIELLERKDSVLQ